MAKDFFDSFSESISRTARELSEKAENFYEVQKLRNQISSEERIISKAKENLGNLIYRRYATGEAVDDEVAAICGEISQHANKIQELRSNAAGKSGQKICPTCQHVIDQKVLFCPFCGTSCVREEPEQVEEQNMAEALEQQPEEDCEEEIQEEEIQDWEAHEEELRENAAKTEKNKESEEI